MFALEAGHAEFLFGGLTAAVAIGDRAGAIGRAAFDFVDAHLRGAGIGEADYDQAVMEQGGVDGEDGRFLAAMLRRRRGEDTADLANEGTLGPEAAGLV